MRQGRAREGCRGAEERSARQFSDQGGIPGHLCHRGEAVCLHCACGCTRGWITASVRSRLPASTWQVGGAPWTRALSAWRSVAGLALQAAPVPGRLRGEVSWRRPDPDVGARNHCVCGGADFAAAPDARNSGIGAESRANASWVGAARKLPHIDRIGRARIGTTGQGVGVTVQHALCRRSDLMGHGGVAGTRSSGLEREHQGQGQYEQAEPSSDRSDRVAHHHPNRRTQVSGCRQSTHLSDRAALTWVNAAELSCRLVAQIAAEADGRRIAEQDDLVDFRAAAFHAG